MNDIDNDLPHRCNCGEPLTLGHRICAYCFAETLVLGLKYRISRLEAALELAKAGSPPRATIMRVPNSLEVRELTDGEEEN